MPHRVTELHNIMPIPNLASVKHYGILSHKAVDSLPHSDVTMPDVQEKRATVSIPTGLALHN